MSTKAEHAFYNSSPWLKVRKQVIARDGGLCVICRSSGVIKPGKEVDHIVPMRERPDLALRVDNLQLLCHNCHVSKTLADGRGIPRICIHGMPMSICRKCEEVDQ